MWKPFLTLLVAAVILFFADQVRQRISIAILPMFYRIVDKGPIFPSRKIRFIQNAFSQIKERYAPHVRKLQLFLQISVFMNTPLWILCCVLHCFFYSILSRYFFMIPNSFNGTVLFNTLPLSSWVKVIHRK